MDPIARAAKIKEALFIRGLSLAAIDRAYKLATGTAATTLREPNSTGEPAIADALGVEAHELWPERYDAKGRRKEPQPRENYRRPLTMQQRREKGAAMAGEAE